jgi:hypothetical protein
MSDRPTLIAGIEMRRGGTVLPEATPSAKTTRTLLIKDTEPVDAKRIIIVSTARY